MEININASGKLEIPTEAKDFIHDKLSGLLMLNRKIMSSKVKIAEIKGIIQCQIKVIPAYDNPVIVKSNGLSIKSAFLDAYNKLEILMQKKKEKKLTKKQKSNLGEVL